MDAMSKPSWGEFITGQETWDTSVIKPPLPKHGLCPSVCLFVCLSCEMLQLQSSGISNDGQTIRQTGGYFHHTSHFCHGV